MMSKSDNEEQNAKSSELQKKKKSSKKSDNEEPIFKSNELQAKKKRKRKRKKESFVAKVGGVYYVEEVADNIRIPFIYRGILKYAEKIMVEKILIAKYYPFFGDEVFDCIRPNALRVDHNEINLLNEINIVYGKCQYLNRPYSTNEVLISMQEVKEMAKFLEVCYNMLVIMRDDVDECGYLRVDDSETLIPFVTVNDKKLIPLFYFEGAHLNLEERVIHLADTWPLAYLKILCKMQNVKRDLFNYCTSMEVVTFEDLMEMMREGANVETCWPDSFECNLLRKIPTNKVTAVKLHKDFKLHVILADEVESCSDNTNTFATQVIAVETDSEGESSSSDSLPNKVTIGGDETPNVIKENS